MCPRGRPRGEALDELAVARKLVDEAVPRAGHVVVLGRILLGEVTNRVPLTFFIPNGAKPAGAFGSENWPAENGSQST